MSPADPIGLTLAVVLGASMVIAFLAALLWDLWSHPADPPRFAGYRVHQGWKVDPVAVLDAELRRGHLTAAIVAVHDRLVTELLDHHRLTPREIRGGLFHSTAARGPAIDRACAAVRSLERTYEVAYRVEDPRRTDLWSEWRRADWTAQVRREFGAELAEVESMWPLLGASA